MPCGCRAPPTSRENDTASSSFALWHLNLRWDGLYYLGGLSLNLFSSAAEAEDALLGYFERIDSLVSEILANARSLGGAFSAYTTKIYSLESSRGRLKDVIDTGLHVVELIDDPLQRNCWSFNLVADFAAGLLACKHTNMELWMFLQRVSPTHTKRIPLL